VTMGGGESHRGEKRASLCSASVCFLGVFCASEKVGLPPEKKILAGRLELDPLVVVVPGSTVRRLSTTSTYVVVVPGSTARRPGTTIPMRM